MTAKSVEDIPTKCTLQGLWKSDILANI